MFEQWHTDRPAAIRTGAILVFFVLYMAIGGFLLVTLFPGFSSILRLLGFAATSGGWIACGALMVLESVEYKRPLPRLLTRFGLLDIFFLSLLAGGLFVVNRF